MATAVAPPTTPKTTTSVDPLYTQAVTQAKAALAGETAPIQAEQSASDAQFAQRQTDATGVAAALSKLLQPIGPAVNGMYQTAAQNQELAANGFSQGMQDALRGNTDNLNAMLKSLNAPVQLDSHAQQAGDVLYGLGGYTPGKTFSQQGAAFGSAAELQAGDALLKGQQNVASLKAQAIVADQGFQAKIAEMAGKLPGDIQANYQKLQSMALQDAKFRQSVAKDKIDAAYKQAQLKLQTAKYNTGVAEFNAKQKLAYAKLARQEFQQNRQYALSLQRLGIAQQSLQLKIAQNAYKQANGGYSQKEITKFTELANAMANQAFHGQQTSRATTTSTTGKNAASGTRSSVTTTGGVPYFQALGGMLKRGIPVQLALDALDRVYPQNAQPSPDALAQNLGPLTPQNVMAQVQTMIKGGTSVLGGAGMVAADASSLLHNSTPATQHIKQYAFSAAARHGWGDNANLSALDQLWTRESGWNPNAVNPSSGAAGIPQALGHGHVFNLGDYQSQVDWGLNYIKGRYGSPAAAWQHELQFGWY